MNAPSEPRRTLPRGRNALDPQVVEADQRRRLLAAMTDLVAERGYAAVRVTDLVALAGVSKPRFYELFESKLGCLLALIDDEFNKLITKVTSTVGPKESIADRIAKGMLAIAEFAREDPRRVQLVFVDGPTAGREALERMHELKEALTGFYVAQREEARAHNPALPPMSQIRAGAIVGAISEIVASDLRRGSEIDVQALADEMTDVVILLAGGDTASIPNKS